MPYLEHSHGAAVVLSAGIGAFVLGELTQVVRLRRGVRASDVPAEVVFRVFFFGGIVALPLCYAHLPGAAIPGGPGLFVAGAVVGWLGLLLRWWSFATLGRYFTTIVKADSDQDVVERGPYRVVRHPSYAGILLAFVGCGLMLANWAGLLISFVLVLGALVYRIRVEERALVDALGSTYGDFARERARLVPFVW